jgi:hypothetical protein
MNVSPGTTTDPTVIKIRRIAPGSYEWVRMCDGAIIMKAIQGLYDHDPKLWMVEYGYKRQHSDEWDYDPCETADFLREIKGMAQLYANKLNGRNDIPYPG